MDKVIEMVQSKGLRKDIPEFRPGDTLRVYVKIEEGGKSRIQRFEGTLISVKGEGISRTITVRKVSQGIGIERIFPIHTPTVDKIEVVRRGKVRRAKLYYLRQRKGKSAKVKERRV